MTLPLPKFHLCIQQPVGYVHSLGFLDQARYFRWQLRRLGRDVTLAKNRLRHDAVNLVFGAHLGFDATQRQRRPASSSTSSSWARAARECRRRISSCSRARPSSTTTPTTAPPTRRRRRRAGRADPARPYLKPAEPLPLEKRPIDLLFIAA
jgi:hypothetical protein